MKKEAEKICLRLDDNILKIVDFISEIEGKKRDEVAQDYFIRGLETFHPFVEDILSEKRTYYYSKSKRRFFLNKPKT